MPVIACFGYFGSDLGLGTHRPTAGLGKEDSQEAPTRHFGGLGLYRYGRGIKAMEKIIIELTEIEVRHLMYLLEVNENSGEYHGNREQYFKRANRIMEKLELKTHKRKPEGKQTEKEK